MANTVSDALLQQAGIEANPVMAAQALLEQGNDTAALKLLQSAVQASPNRADAWFSLGQVQGRMGDFRNAAQSFKRAIKLAPAVADGYVHLGNAFLRQGRVNQAISTYRDGLKQQPQQPLLHFNLGVALRQSGDTEGAIASYRQAIALFPEYAQAYFSLGNALRDSGKPAEAEAAYRRALELQPDFVDAQANLAGILASQDNHAAAIDASAAVLARVPTHVHALRNLSLSLYRVGRYREGADVTFRALAVAPGETMLQYHMGEMLYGLVRTGEADLARQLAQRWKAMFPADAVAQHMAAAMLGEAAPARADDTYVRETFDRFAGDFETVLAKLGYRVPEMLCGKLLAAAGGRSGLAMLDAGCGTGLCAPFLRPAARRLVGVDLSGGMLAKARERKLYDGLHEAELGAFLAKAQERYDLTVAADVFCYFGDLLPSFRAIAAVSAPQALLGFTVEAAPAGLVPDSYRLGSTGRYQHDAGYVKRVLDQAGFDLVTFENTHGREEMGEPVPCYMVIARRR